MEPLLTLTLSLQGEGMSSFAMFGMTRRDAADDTSDLRTLYYETPLGGMR
jgi:hypothetical protein